MFMTKTGLLGRIASALGAIVLPLSLAACDQQEPAAQASTAQPPAVFVQPVERREIVEAFEVLGRVAAVDRVELRARVEGELIERRFTEGRDVEQGDVLFVIDPASFQAGVELAEANLASARAVLIEAEPALSRAEVLVARGNVSEATLDEARAAALQAEASVQARQADLALAEIELGYTEVTAPISGRIGRTEYSLGNLIGPNSDVLATVTSLDPIYVLFSISDRDVVTMRQRAVENEMEFDPSEILVRLRLSNDSIFDQQGRIDFVASEVDPATGLVEIRVEFPNPNSVLLPDQFVNVLLSGPEPQNRLVVPQAAIQEDQQGRYVLVVDADNLVQVNRVTTGIQDGTDWVVEGGLEEGQLIIVEGLQRVRPGIEVSPTPAPTAAATTAGG